MSVWRDGKTVSMHNKDDGVGVFNWLVGVIGDEAVTPMKDAFMWLAGRMLRDTPEKAARREMKAAVRTENAKIKNAKRVLNGKGGGMKPDAARYAPAAPSSRYTGQARAA